MTDERFLQILKAYGANPQRWPVAERAQAEAYAARRRDELAAALAAEAEPDALLGSAEGQPGDVLQRRTLRSLPQPQGCKWVSPLRPAAVLVSRVLYLRLIHI